MGNQLTKDKVLEINALSPLPYDPPKPVPTEDMEVVDEEAVVPENTSEEKEKEPPTDEEGQTLLF